jgi:hypothetical protein
MIVDQEATSRGQLYVAAQRAKIHTQSQFIRLLVSQDADLEIVRVERETLAEMQLSLGLALSRLGIVSD